MALERMHPQDADGNTVLATHCGIKTKGCVIAADKVHLIATVGVENLLIVQDGNATLVADRREEGTIKQLVELLKKKELGEKIEPAKAGPAPGVVNLMDALRASLDYAKKKAPAPSVEARRPAKKKAGQK